MHSMHRYGEYQHAPEAVIKELTPLAEGMQNHPSIKKLSHDKIELLRKYMEESQKGRSPKQLRVVSKNFIERCPSSLLEMVTEKTYQEFYSFLKMQKRMDNEKLKKMSRLAEDW